MRIALCICPQWSVQTPSFAIGSLKSHIKNKDVEVEQFDLNIRKEGLLTALPFFIIILPMNRAKLKVLMAALKEVVDEIDSEIYSDVGEHVPQDSVESDYDEVF